MEAIDRKYLIDAVSLTSGKRRTHNDAVLFLAKDAALPETLRFYHDACERRGADEAQLKGIRLLIERVETYQKEHPELVKVADIGPGVEEDRVNWPNAK